MQVCLHCLSLCLVCEVVYRHWFGVKQRKGKETKQIIYIYVLGKVWSVIWPELGSWHGR